MRLLRVAATCLMAACGLLLGLACGDDEPPASPAPVMSPPTRSPGIPMLPNLGGQGLQQQIDSALPGDTIVVPAGSYPGGIRIDKALTLEGPGAQIDAACRADYGIEIAAADVTIIGLEVRNALDSNISIGQVANVRLQDLKLRDWNCADIDVQSRAAIACWYCSSLTVINSDLQTSRVFGNGIWVKSTSDLPSTGGHVIAGNRISGGFDAIGSEAEDDPMGGFLRDTLIADNHIENCHDDGIQVEGRNERVIVRGNTVSGCGIGIAFAPNLVGPLLIEDNVLTDMQPGFYEQQACFKLGDGGQGWAELRGNVCRSAGEGLKQTNSGLAPLVVHDNCFEVTSYAYYLTDYPVGTFESNSLATSNALLIRWGHDVYEGLGDFQQATGQERSAKNGRCS